ncbi:hypothetical protein [Microbacterium sp. MYb66]|jgi:hypothetical protein|uniref:hypothetical protein n=1 Tax=Microbacterium sp. MYb66 TaxID=1848692 RepID=UPI0015E48EC2|nr:hypothetical protein [Microbacterium sp. MYb66]
MSDVNRQNPNDEDYGDLGEKRNRRMRIVAWTVIIALILGGGGATLFALLPV